ncbi:sugar phosphate isomerase/epimerase [Ginsengibacter hankyongi]|uniref:Sugar phosphate isomerase/epimerase n=1 Tax=Ginsengibacter hankyongi TaxID=2607284 RepID=A0A5J5IGE7_9BACT|nr:TIM barrel protein [Ginsengibacter hankyongi]KAA9038084.1 sugar phosphate isomerase/epimerase [Ginsengibacter hankyongi]
MNTSRRTFIKTGSITIGGAAMLPDILKEKKTNAILGLQLYTVRDDMKTDPAGTLKRLAAMGFKYVEHAGYHDRKFYGYSIPDFKNLLKDNGLKMESGHNPLTSKYWDKATNDFTEEWKYTIEDSAAIGLKYMISPGVDESMCKNMDDFKLYMDMHNKTGELCKKAGTHFAFHNESYEFNHSLNGTVLYDLLLQLTDKSLVAQQIDIGNMYEPGGRPLYYLKKYSGRFLLMHVKDELKRDSPGTDGRVYENTLLGKGVIDVKNVVDYARKTGTKYFIIEQEEYQGIAPLDCAKEDLEKMKGWGF